LVRPSKKTFFDGRKEKIAMTKFLILLQKFTRSKDLTKEIPYTKNLFSRKKYFFNQFKLNFLVFCKLVNFIPSAHGSMSGLNGAMSGTERPNSFLDEFW